MSTLIHLVVLCVLFLIMGFLATPPGRRQWRRLAGFLGAIGLGLAMTVAGMIVVIVMLGAYIGGTALLDLEVGLFLGVISVALASGIVMFLIVEPLIRAAGISAEILTITEYYIQWFLIYVTVYQVLFDQLNGLGRMLREQDLSRELDSYLSSVLNPSVLIAILLPVLLSIWVAVAIAKLRLAARSRPEVSVPAPNRGPTPPRPAPGGGEPAVRRRSGTRLLAEATDRPAEATEATGAGADAGGPAGPGRSDGAAGEAVSPRRQR